MMQRLAGVASLLLLTACTGGGETTEYSIVSSGEARLLVVTPGEGSFTAAAAGTLRLNEAGCFAMDDFLLVVALDAEVLPGGTGIQVDGVGSIEIGDPVSGGGGYDEISELHRGDGFQECAAGATEYFQLSSP